MRWNGVLLAAGALFCSTAVSAQPTQIEATAAADAERRGAQMFVYDQAAWHATDRFQADVASRSAADRATLIGQLEGYIVEPSSDGTPVTTFFGSDASGRFAVARYTGSSETEMRGGFVPPDSDRGLSLMANTMIDSRTAAIQRMAEPDHGVCSHSPPNSLVLPPDENGVISAYVLTSTLDENIYPAGGHYRFDFTADGTPVGERAFMTGCLPVPLRDDDGTRPEMFVLTHLLDPQPTEIHAFVSRYIPFPLMVITVPNRHVWGITNGKVEFVEVLTDEN